MCGIVSLISKAVVAEGLFNFEGWQIKIFANPFGFINHHPWTWSVVMCAN